MKKNLFGFLLLCLAINSFALDGNHFTITRITAPYFIVDGNSPTTLNKAYVGFEIKNNSNSGVTYSGLRFQITSVGTSVVGQNYSFVAPTDGKSKIGTLAPGQSKTCYFYISYPSAVAPQGTFNVQLTDNTAGVKTQSFVIINRSSISANAGGTATQSFTNQDLIGGLVYDDVTYVVGNVKAGDESDFQVAVSPQFDPTKIELLGTEVLSSAVPGIPVGSTDSLYYVTGAGSNGASVTIRWTFKITAVNFTNYLLPCAGATSGSTNYKYALNTALGQGTPITVSASANPLTITKTSDQPVYGANRTATFTVTISNPGLFGVTIDGIADQVPTGFTFQNILNSSDVNAGNSTSVPIPGATGSIVFEGGVSVGGNTSYYIPAGGSISLRYTALSPSYSTLSLLTTASGYVGNSSIGSAVNTVAVSATLPNTLLSFAAGWTNERRIKIDWKIINESAADRFELERNNGEGIFTSIAKIKTTGITGIPQNYSFIDSFPRLDKNEYRLKMINAGNTTKYSPIVFVNQKQDGWDIVKLFPVPFTGELNIQVGSGKKIDLQVELFNAMGDAVLRRNLDCINGTNNILLDNLGQLIPGVYYLVISDGVKSVRQRLVKTM